MIDELQVRRNFAWKWQLKKFELNILFFNMMLQNWEVFRGDSKSYYKQKPEKNIKQKKKFTKSY